MADAADIDMAEAESTRRGAVAADTPTVVTPAIAESQPPPPPPLPTGAA